MSKPVVAITRPRDRAAKACKIVEELGGEAILAPTLDLKPVNTQSLKDLVSAKDTLDWIVFTSPTTIVSLNKFYPEFLKSLDCKLAVIGNKTGKLAEGLEKLGNTVILAEAYKSLFPMDDEKVKELISKIENSEIDAITFTSPLTVENFFEISDDKERLAQLLSNNLLTVSIGPITGRVLDKYNIAYIYPDTYTVRDMMELLFEELNKE